MKALLICPARREAVAALAESGPLSNLPILGKTLIEYWLEHLSALGAREVHVLATDRPEQVRSLVGNGARWGLRVEVFPEIREPTSDEARARFRGEGENDAGWLPRPHDATVLDHLPGLPEFPLFSSYAGWFAALQAWMPSAATPGRLGMREIHPGVWTGLRVHLAATAQLRAPCWIGDDVRVDANAAVGPMAVLESGALVAPGAEVSRSLVGPQTVVGKFTQIRDSIAWGSTLVNWRLGSCIKVPDPFLLCSIVNADSSSVSSDALSRLAAALALVLTLPAALLHCLKAKLRGWPALRPLVAVRPRTSHGIPLPDETLIYYELTSARGWLRRWPQLWKIVRGDFAWVGNRPLSPRQAASLSNDFERLWLSAPMGFISLADAEGCTGSFNDEARAHASYYATQMSWRLNWVIFGRALFLLAFGIPYGRVREQLVQVLQPGHAEIRRAQ